MTWSVFLSFNGNCREAMEYYRHIFRGNLSFWTLEECESWRNENKANSMKFGHLIVRADLNSPLIKIVGTDLMGNEKRINGNSISLLVQFEDDNELKSVFQLMKEKSSKVDELTVNAYHYLMGGLTDPYGIQWLFSCQLKPEDTALEFNDHRRIY